VGRGLDQNDTHPASSAKQRIRDLSASCQSLFDECQNTKRLEDCDWLETRRGQFNVWVFDVNAAKMGGQLLAWDLRPRHPTVGTVYHLLEALKESLEQCLARTGIYLPTQSLRRDRARTCEWQAVNANDYEPADLELEQSRAAVDSLTLTTLFELEEDLPRERVVRPDSPQSSDTSEDDDDDDDDDGAWKRALSEQDLIITTILGQLRKITAEIWQSGAGRDYATVDSTFREERNLLSREPWRTVIQKASLTALPRAGEPIKGNAQLTPVQERLVRANTLRQHRVRVLTGPVSHASETRGLPLQLPLATPSRAILVTAQDSIFYSWPSQIRTAALRPGPGSSQKASGPSKSSSSAPTTIAGTVATQGYPPCPRSAPHGTAAGVVKCPYCAGLLPEEYAQDEALWR
jgi:hypothetical protein